MHLKIERTGMTENTEIAKIDILLWFLNPFSVLGQFQQKNENRISVLSSKLA